MKKVLTKRITIVACLCFCVAVIGIMGLIFRKSEQPFEVQALTVEAQVDVNDCVYGEEKTFSSTVSVELDGATKTAKDGVLIYPDGTVYAISEDSFRFLQTGEYTLRYFYKDDKVAVIAEKKFDICNDLYTTSGGTKSSAYAVTSVEMKGNKPQSVADDVTITKEDALIVRLEDGSKFTYEKPIDLSSADADGLASIMRFDLKMFAFDGLSGSTYNFQKWIARGMKIRLTDCYDPTVYVETTLTVQQNNKKPPHYAYDGPMVRASTNMLPNAGIELPSTVMGNNATSKDIYVDGIHGRFYMNNYGTGAGSYKLLTVGTNGVELLFDYEKSRLYSRSTSGSTDTTMIVADFTNKVYGDIKYEPFTTGEVYLSIEFSDYQSAELARVDIFSLGKDDGAYLTDTANLEYKDAQKPKLDVLFEPTESNYGYVAVGEYFTIPSATSTDVNAVGGIDVAVYKNYESAYKTMVSVENGKFKVEEADIYYVEYTARDTFGNIQTEVIKVYGVHTEKGKKTVDVNIGTKFDTFLAGETYVVEKPTISTLNKAECLSLKVQIECTGKQSLTLADLYGKDEIDAFFETECSFVPLYAGEYTITYQFGDNVMQYDQDGISYTVTSNVSDAVNFLDKPFLDRYLIKDAEYSFEALNAYRYSTGEPVEEKNVTAYISFDGGAYSQIEDLNKVKITGSGTARLKYACGDAFVESDLAQIVDVNYANPRKLKIENYFVQDGMALSDGNSLIYKTTKVEGDASLRFINRISYQSFMLKFMVDSGYSNYEKLNIILTDPYKTDKKVVVSYYTDSAGNLVVSVNGGEGHIVNDSFSSSEEKMIMYSFKSKRLSISNCTDIVLVDFDFASSTAYLDVECIGLTGTGGIRINAINNQNVTAKTVRDNKSPELYEENVARGTYAKGTVLKIYPLEYCDVLSPVLNGMMSVTVTDEKGNYLTSVDGVVMNGVDNDPNQIYEVAFTQFGEYYVDYTCMDLQENPCSTKHFIVIKDCQDPVLTLTGKIAEGGTVTMKKGETLVVTYTVQDETSTKEELESYITVMDMNSHYIYGYHQTNQLLFSYTGTFTVTITCRDASANYTEKSFTVVVE